MCPIDGIDRILEPSIYFIFFSTARRVSSNQRGLIISFADAANALQDNVKISAHSLLKMLENILLKNSNICMSTRKQIDNPLLPNSGYRDKFKKNLESPSDVKIFINKSSILKLEDKQDNFIHLSFFICIYLFLVYYFIFFLNVNKT